MSDGNVNKDIEESSRNVKSSDEAAEVVEEMEKIIKSNKLSSYGLPTNKMKYLKMFKVNDKFINMVKGEEKAKIASLFMYF